MMNPIRAGREKIGWPVARLAATVSISVDELLQIESAPVDWGSKGAMRLRNALEFRGVTFADDDNVIGPNDPSVIAALTTTLSADQKEQLSSLSDRGAGGIPCRDIRDFSSLRFENLVQCGTVKRIIIFDNEDVQESTGENRVRLSARGRLVSQRIEEERRQRAAEFAASLIS